MIAQMNEQAQSGPLQWIADSTAAQPVGIIGGPIPEELAGLSKEPVIYAHGQYADQNGKTWEFEKMDAVKICVLLLMGKIAQMEIYKTWAENE